MCSGSDCYAVVSQYVDDTAVIVFDDSSLAQVFQIYSKFELASGAKINMDKCGGLWLGPWATRVDSPFGIKWVLSSCKFLGILNWKF